MKQTNNNLQKRIHTKLFTIIMYSKSMNRKCHFKKRKPKQRKGEEIVLRSMSTDLIFKQFVHTGSLELELTW